MARIILKGIWPTCAGCKAEMAYAPSGLSSHIRSITPYDAEHRQEGLRRPSATMVAEFAAAHRDCPEPAPEVWGVTEHGFPVIDRRTR